MADPQQEFDDFGLPIRRHTETRFLEETRDDGKKPKKPKKPAKAKTDAQKKSGSGDSVDAAVDGGKDAVCAPVPAEAIEEGSPKGNKAQSEDSTPGTKGVAFAEEKGQPMPTEESPWKDTATEKDGAEENNTAVNYKRASAIKTADAKDIKLSEFSHMKLANEDQEEEEVVDVDGGWQTMPAYAPYDIYDDDNRLVAREHNNEDDEAYSYAGMGGAGKGYTRVLVDDDAESATSMDDNTNYLFKNAGGTALTEDDDQTRDAVSQMQATKDLLTEGQKIAYVGLTRIELSQMVKDLDHAEYTKGAKKQGQLATEATRMWAQKIMIRLYTHMEITSAEQVMIEQLSEHGVISSDLTPQLMANARVKNPMADRKSSVSSSRPSINSVTSPRASIASPRLSGDETPAEPPPAYDKHEGEELPAVRTPSQLPSSDKLDIDIRWTILCDLFLVLIADSIYDSRSRVLFERVGKALEIDWIDICRFERRVTEALEMQQQAERENWNEDEHMESRRKLALKKRYIVMGLATVGGGLVIGLSAGLLAPVIGAGLAAGFTTIGVTGTSSFLAGSAGAAIITSGAGAAGSVIGAKAANRRTGAVKTFEYRPLHNNKRVNLVLTISGWMTGKVDDVRLPFSTVDPVMGDIYSVLWEPEMLTSMGDTINILATEVGSPAQKL